MREGLLTLISLPALMDEGVSLRIIDTPAPLTCFPIKLISFCQFISSPLRLELHQSRICSGEINKSQMSSMKGLPGQDGPGAQGRPHGPHMPPTRRRVADSAAHPRLPRAWIWQSCWVSRLALSLRAGGGRSGTQALGRSSWVTFQGGGLGQQS